MLSTVIVQGLLVMSSSFPVLIGKSAVKLRLRLIFSCDIVLLTKEIQTASLLDLRQWLLYRCRLLGHSSPRYVALYQQRKTHPSSVYKPSVPTASCSIISTDSKRPLRRIAILTGSQASQLGPPNDHAVIACALVDHDPGHVYWELHLKNISLRSKNLG